jgi:hypothetical protein
MVRIRPIFAFGSVFIFIIRFLVRFRRMGFEVSLNRNSIEPVDLPPAMRKSAVGDQQAAFPQRK